MDRILPKRFLRPLMFVLVALVAIASLVWLRSIFTPLLAGLFIAYILDPLADGLERRGMRRLPAVVLIFLLASLVLIGAVLAGTVAVARGGATLASRLAGDTSISASLAPQHPEAQQSGSGDWYIDQDGDGVFDPGWVREAQTYLERDYPGVAIGFNRWKNGIAERYGADEDLDPEMALARRVESGLDATAGRVIEAWFGSGEESQRWAGEGLTEALERIGSTEKTAEQTAGPFERLLELGSWLLLVPIYVFFFLIEIDPMIARGRQWIPVGARARANKIAGEIHQILSAFFRGRLLVCVIKGVLTGLGLQLTGVPYGFLVGFAAGFLSLLPYIGVWLAAIPALGMCWFEHHDLWLLLATAGVFSAMEAVEGLVLIPRLLGDEVGLHPVTVIVTFLIFTHWFGIIGMLLSVPLAAIAKTLAREFVVPLLTDDAAHDPPDPTLDSSTS
ncbi:MAG: AI-2E family transporter [Planctomycetota bacterium]|nr:AI-2E family transporter [Planctomycetota bacterium]